MMDGDTHSKAQVLLQMVDRHQKCASEVSLDSQLDLNTLGFLSVPANKNL